MVDKPENTPDPQKQEMGPAAEELPALRSKKVEEKGGTPEQPSFEKLQASKPQVADNKTKNMAVAGALIALVIFFIYQLFSGESSAPVEAEKAKGKSLNTEPEVVTMKETPKQTFEPIPPPPPEAPPEAPPPPPPPAPVTPPPPPSLEAGNSRGGGGSAIALQERINSPMFVGGEGGGVVSSITGALQGGAETAESGFNLEPTDAPQAVATISGDPYTMVYQGKIIDAVLESAINTELPGTIRAVVSRDVYAEAGKEVLIPKGSRLVGTYDSEIQRGQGRVYMVWERVIRPDGIDIKLQSPVVDPLGRSGIAGEVDNRFFEVVSNSFLMSIVSVGLAQFAESIGADGIEQGSTASGDSTTSGDLTSVATTDAIDEFGSNVDAIIEQFLDARPRILIAQGQTIKVFVNRDLIFPQDTIQGVQIIQ